MIIVTHNALVKAMILGIMNIQRYQLSPACQNNRQLTLLIPLSVSVFENVLFRVMEPKKKHFSSFRMISIINEP